MATVTESAIWEAGVYQLEETDLVLGGVSGISNQQAKQLANRTVWLKGAITGFTQVNMVTASQTLSEVQTSNCLVVIDANNATLTVGLPTGVAIGTRVSIMAINVNKSQVTISVTGTNIIIAGTNRSKIYLGNGDFVYLVLSDTGWLLVNFDGNILTVGKLSYGYKADANTVVADGRLLKRVDYPRLWEFAQSIGGSLIADFGWLNTPGNKGFFSTGDNATTFRIPDLRAMFIRGLDLAAGIDFGRQSETPGGYEADDIKSHNHSMGKENVQGGTSATVGDASGEGSGGDYPAPKGTGFTGGLETRPKNIGLIPLINL